MTATSRSTIEELLRDFYAARTGGDLDRLCRMFAPDAQFRISGSSEGKAIGVSARGTAEIRTWLGVMVKTFRLRRFEVLSMLVDGESAAVHWRADIDSRVTGVVVPTELVDMVRVDGRLITSYVELFVPS
jgi:ketosteroid isomerase-like protein